MAESKDVCTVTLGEVHVLLLSMDAKIDKLIAMIESGEDRSDDDLPETEDEDFIDDSEPTPAPPPKKVLTKSPGQLRDFSLASQRPYGLYSSSGYIRSNFGVRPSNNWPYRSPYYQK